MTFAESKLATLWFPLFGVLLSNVLYMAPMPAVYKAYNRGALGDLNVLPLAFMSVSTVSWLAYAFSVPNPFIVASNLPGAAVAMAYTVITLPLVRSPAERQAVQGVMVGSVGVVSLLWCYLIFSGIDASRRSFLLGAFGSAICVVLFASPLSTMGEVIATRNSASIYAPLTFAQVTNCGTWSVYGLAIGDIWVWGPNLCGLMLGLMQLLLKILFPSYADKTTQRLCKANGSDPDSDDTP